MLEIGKVKSVDSAKWAGMSKEEQKAYLMEYMGWTDDGPSAEETGLTEPAEWDIDHPFGL